MIDLNLINVFLASIILLTVIVMYFGIVVANGKMGRFMVLIPAAMVLCASMFLTIKEIQSLPIEGMPVEEFQMVHHVTDGTTIYLWAVEGEDEFPKTFVFPYTDDAARKLAEGEQSNQNGVPIMMEVKPGSEEGGGVITILGSPQSTQQDRSSRKDYE